jgi:hypothetical protein
MRFKNSLNLLKKTFSNSQMNSLRSSSEISILTYLESLTKTSKRTRLVRPESGKVLRKVKSEKSGKHQKPKWRQSSMTLSILNYRKNFHQKHKKLLRMNFMAVLLDQNHWA